jgi:hypothetical protein
VHPDELQHGSDQPTLIHLTLSQLIFLFPKVKTALKRFSDAKNIRENIPAKLNTVPLDVFNDCFVPTFGNTESIRLT